MPSSAKDSNTSGPWKHYLVQSLSWIAFRFPDTEFKTKEVLAKKKTKNKEKGKHSRLSLPCCLLNDHWESNRYIRICPTYVTKPSVVISLSTSSSCLSDTVISFGFKWRLLEDRKEGKTAEFVHVKEKNLKSGSNRMAQKKVLCWIIVWVTVNSASEWGISILLLFEWPEGQHRMETGTGWEWLHDYEPGQHISALECAKGSQQDSEGVKWEPVGFTPKWSVCLF